MRRHSSFQAACPRPAGVPKASRPKCNRAPQTRTPEEAAGMPPALISGRQPGSIDVHAQEAPHPPTHPPTLRSSSFALSAAALACASARSRCTLIWVARASMISSV